MAKKRKMKKKKKEERKKDLINLMRRGWVTLRSRASELSRPRPVVKGFVTLTLYRTLARLLMPLTPLTVMAPPLNQRVTSC